MKNRLLWCQSSSFVDKLILKHIMLKQIVAVEHFFMVTNWVLNA